MKIERSSTAARWVSGRFLAKRTRRFFNARSNASVSAFSASPEMTTKDESFPRCGSLFFTSETPPLLENNSIQFSSGQFFSVLPLPG
jgi:hypothetical protein